MPVAPGQPITWCAEWDGAELVCDRDAGHAPDGDHGLHHRAHVQRNGAGPFHTVWFAATDDKEIEMTYDGPRRFTLELRHPHVNLNDPVQRDALSATVAAQVHAQLAEQGRQWADGKDIDMSPGNDPTDPDGWIITVKGWWTPAGTPARAAHRPRLLVDFDGVIHAYSRGWDDGTAYDRPMPGALEALSKLYADGYEIVVFSTRDAKQITEWLERYEFPAYRVTNVKEPAVAIIDDRAIRFTDWDQADDDVRELHPIGGGR